MGEGKRHSRPKPTKLNIYSLYDTILHISRILSLRKKIDMFKSTIIFQYSIILDFGIFEYGFLYKSDSKTFFHQWRFWSWWVLSYFELRFELFAIYFLCFFTIIVVKIFIFLFFLGTNFVLSQKMFNVLKRIKKEFFYLQKTKFLGPTDFANLIQKY